MIRISHAADSSRVASAAAGLVAPVTSLADKADDRRLLELGEKIFEHSHITDELEERAAPLLEVWLDETKRLHDASCTGECTAHYH
jgi:hypothetical protein